MKRKKKVYRKVQCPACHGAGHRGYIGMSVPVKKRKVKRQLVECLWIVTWEQGDLQRRTYNIYGDEETATAWAEIQAESHGTSRVRLSRVVREFK